MNSGPQSSTVRMGFLPLIEMQGRGPQNPCKTLGSEGSTPVTKSRSVVRGDQAVGCRGCWAAPIPHSCVTSGGSFPILGLSSNQASGPRVPEVSVSLIFLLQGSRSLKTRKVPNECGL